MVRGIVAPSFPVKLTHQYGSLQMLCMHPKLVFPSQLEQFTAQQLLFPEWNHEHFTDLNS